MMRLISATLISTSALPATDRLEHRFAFRVLRARIMAVTVTGQISIAGLLVNLPVNPRRESFMALPVVK
jgi:hypothetical protein